jgi:hypothetical protein
MRSLSGVVSLALLGVVLAGCARPPAREIGRDRAVAIARSQIGFQPSNIDAVKASAAGRPIWRVTIRGRLPGQPPELFETRIIEIDRVSGAIVSIARS